MKVKFLDISSTLFTINEPHLLIGLIRLTKTELTDWHSFIHPSVHLHFSQLDPIEQALCALGLPFGQIYDLQTKPSTTYVLSPETTTQEDKLLRLQSHVKEIPFSDDTEEKQISGVFYLVPL